MKLNRNDLKKILKECILELAQEGKIFQANSQILSEVANREIKFQDVVAPQANPVTTIENNKLAEAVAITSRMISKSDPKSLSLYSNIIADTARTTLQKQLANETGGSPMANESYLSEEDKMVDAESINVFQAKDRWAAIAFAKKK